MDEREALTDERELMSGDLSYVMSVQITLDAHDIPHREELLGLGPWERNRVFVSAEDYERALAAIRDVEHHTSLEEPADRRYPRFVLIVATFVLLVVAALMLARGLPR